MSDEVLIFASFIFFRLHWIHLFGRIRIKNLISNTYVFKLTPVNSWYENEKGEQHKWNEIKNTYTNKQTQCDWITAY